MFLNIYGKYFVKITKDFGSGIVCNFFLSELI